MKVVERRASADGSIKYLWELGDRNTVESIFFRLDGLPHTCISSQVGCNVGCLFCETGKQPVLGNLTPDQIIDQVSGAIADGESDFAERRFSSVLFAGMGEPLHNYDSVCAAGRRMLDEGLTERVTITTSGVVPKIRELVDEPISILSVSLHATTNEVRSRLVPINRKYPIEELIDAATFYRERSGNQVIMNYLLFEGVNDSDDDARRLSEMLDPSLFTVKLKEWNAIPDTALQRSSPERYRYFQDVLDAHQLSVTVCASRGVDVGGGCGQLRSKHAPLAPVWKRRMEHDDQEGGRDGR